MCGIVGYTGRAQAAPILLDGLERLEYRGYDSAGICVSGPGGLRLVKAKGRLEALRTKLGGEEIAGTCGIGHTRWATHGEPSDANAHPHLSCGGKIALVHNGIIENSGEIRSFLQDRGVAFLSDTDSEAIVQLLGYRYRESRDLFAAIYSVLHDLRGAYALGIVCADDPGTVVAARKDAPLLIGYGDGCSLIASDATALVRHTRDAAVLDDGEVAFLSPDGVRVYDALGERVHKRHRALSWSAADAEKGGCAHYMFKEILEQPEALERCAAPHLQDGRLRFPEVSLSAERLRAARRLYIVACGSSWHAAVAGKYAMEKMLRIPVDVQLASEFRYACPLVGPETPVLFLSQSGETLDTLAALRQAKRMGAYTLSVVNVAESSIAREADDTIFLNAGPEIAVATTKAYSAQLMALDLLCLYFAEGLGTLTEDARARYAAELPRIPGKLRRVLADRAEIGRFASRYFSRSSVFFIGRNLDYALGLEGSLKLKEISYIHSEAYPAGELKHGTISLVEKGTLVVALATCGPLFEKALANIAEVRARGADILALTTESRAAGLRSCTDCVLTVPDTEELFLPLLGIAPLQLFAYDVALQRGCDIDKPRNLAKSVTVE